MTEYARYLKLTLIGVITFLFLPVVNMVGLTEPPITIRAPETWTDIDRSHSIEGFEGAAQMLTNLLIALVGLVVLVFGQNHKKNHTNNQSALLLQVMAFSLSILLSAFTIFSARVAIIDSISLNAREFSYSLDLLGQAALFLNFSFACATTLIYSLIRET